MPKAVRTAHVTRRRFLQMLAGLALSAGAVSGYVRYVEPRWLSVEQLDMPIAALPPTLDGKRLVQLSDIHLSEYFSHEQFANAIDKVAWLKPDWLVLTGDFVGNDADASTGLVEPLRVLDMPLYAVYGNHDYWSDKATVTRNLQEAGVKLLVNESSQIDSGLWLAGVDDVWSGHPDLKAAMRDVPAHAPTILLAHEPDYFDTVLHEQAPVAWQLSGHSHGGQVRLPSIKADSSGLYSHAPVLPMYGRRYSIGHHSRNGISVYTNRGLGMWPLPYRFNCRPELTVFTLRAA